MARTALEREEWPAPDAATPGRAGATVRPIEPDNGLTVSHNLAGQRLGRKGRDTRERILAAAQELIESQVEVGGLSMSAVARRASLGMTSLYNYFADLTELVLAVLEPVTASAEDAYLARLRERWDDAELAERCFAFVHAYHWFWARNSRLLHLRNAMSDGRDMRMVEHRIGSTQPIIVLLVRQMDGDPGALASPPVALASMLMIGVERSITITTDRELPRLAGYRFVPNDDRFIRPAARMLELAIRDARAACPR